MAISSPKPPALVDGALQSGLEAIIHRVIPVNIFTDATQNYVPAVVVLATLYGIAMQTTATKATVIDVLACVKSASVKIWQWADLLGHGRDRRDHAAREHDLAVDLRASHCSSG